MVVRPLLPTNEDLQPTPPCFGWGTVKDLHSKGNKRKHIYLCFVLCILESTFSWTALNKNIICVNIYLSLVLIKPMQTRPHDVTSLNGSGLIKNNNNKG